METKKGTKVANRLININGKLHDIFCNGGESSVKFHAASLGEEVEIKIRSEVNDKFFSSYPLLYIE